LRQDFDLLLPAALKESPAFFSPAGGNEYSARAVAAQPGKESFPLFRAAKIVQSQFQRASFAEAPAHQRPHLLRCFRGGDAANAIFPEESLHAHSTPEAKL
jgi:hypothetical protein